MFPVTYRSAVTCRDLVCFDLSVKETDLHVCAAKNLRSRALRLVLKYRKQLEDYIVRNPAFRTSLVPIAQSPDAPLIAREMIEASAKAGVGPMAAGAGAGGE